jgi:hypothetical protein
MWQDIPTLNSPESEIREWQRIHLDYCSPRRRFQTQRAGTNLWFYHGRQWVVGLPTLAPHNGG